MKKLFVSLLSIIAITSCSGEPPADTPRGPIEPAAAPGSVIRAGSSGAGGGDITACNPPIDDVCSYTCGGWPVGHPAGCVCGLECLPATGPCMDVVCDGALLPYQGGACSEHFRAPGLWCLTGVGACDGKGNCLPPAGTCDPVAALPAACSANADCDDGDPCTKDFCVGLHCLNQPVVNGTACGAGKTCSAGACCAP